MMNFRTHGLAVKALAGVTGLGLLAMAGCSSASGDDGGGDAVKLVGYSVLEQANEGVISAFNETDAGKDVEFSGSYGASGDQARAVIGGQDADAVHLSLEPDVKKLVDEGLVAEDWKDNDTNGICTTSIVVMVVKAGNPKNIETWADLAEPGVEIVTPNPASSGSAKWNALAAYGSVTAGGGSEADAAEYMKKFYGNVVSMPDSGRDATTAFTSGTGDVLLSYENEAILARQSGTELDYVVPDSTLLIENPCATVDGASKTAEDFLEFQKGPEAQQAYAETGYRPLETVASEVGDVEVEGVMDDSDPFPAPEKVLTIDDDFGGWEKADAEYFDEDNGTLIKLQAENFQ